MLGAGDEARGGANAAWRMGALDYEEAPVRVGYCVPVVPELASYRLRVAIPSQHLGCEYRIGSTGNPTFFFKNGNVSLAEKLTGVVYDVVNNHFKGKYAAEYHGMCSVADTITVASELMAEIVHEHTGREAVVIDDPYETPELEPKCYGTGVVWYGHAANLASLLPHMEAVTEADGSLIVCSNLMKAHVPWSLENEQKCLQGAAVALLTGSSPGASANRVVKAIRAGRFVVAPQDCAESWRELSPFIWIGDVAEGLKWAFNNREDVCQKITQGQKYTRARFDPTLIGARWTEVFASI